MNDQWKWWHTFLLVILVPGLILLASWKLELVWAWAATMALLAGFLFVAGSVIVGLLRGAFVDDRNKVSLSRFQALLWTILVLAGYLAAAIANIRTGKADPLLIQIPQELWWLIGISATSLVGSPLVRSTRERQPANPEVATQTLRKMGLVGETETVTQQQNLVTRNSDGAIVARGKIAVAPTASSSSWADLFKGDETSNGDHLDLAKVQMFFFTLILVLSYAVALGKLFASVNQVADFPDLNEGTIALLGISHAAYLTNKAVPRT